MNRFRSRGWAAALIGVAAIWALGMLVPAHGAPGIRVLVDDLPLALIPPASVVDDFLYLPLRPLAQQFNATVTFGNREIEVRRPDGVTFTLRTGRLEIWSDGMVVAVVEAPVRLVNGATMIPKGAVDVLFDALTVWNRQEHLVVIVTRKIPFHVTTTSKPLPPPGTVRPAANAPREFVPEFRPDLDRPVVASGHVTLGLSLGGDNGFVATGRVAFRSHGGPDRIEGAMALATGNGSVQAAGTVTLKRTTSTFTLGGFSVHDSPLTLYEQGLIGLMYQGYLGRFGTRMYAANIPNSSVHVYGVGMSFPPVGSWLLNGELMYSPETGALVARGRAARPLRPGLAAFAEIAAGSSAAGSGTAWRVGITAGTPRLTASLSYLSLSAGFPTVGNAALFAGRTGPLLQLSYRPTPQWTFLASAAFLSGVASGVPDRTAYSLLASYRPTPTLSFAAEVRTIEDTSSGVRTRSTAAQAAVAFTPGRWGIVLAGSHNAEANLLTGITDGTSTFSLRAGYTLRNGLPVWAEISRSIGSTTAWTYGLGATFRLNARMDLSAQVRQKFYSLPSVYTETALEVGVSRPLSNGAHLTMGAGVRHNSSSGAATPFLSFQYGYPVHMYGEARVGKLGGLMFVDANGNGRWDAGEAGVPGVVLRLGDRSAAISNEAGKVAVEGVREGEYAASLDEDTIPAGLVAVQAKQIVRVAANETASLEFALAPAAAVRGVLFIDENGNGVRDRNERGADGVVVVLQPGGRIYTTEADGAFEFAHLAAGTYTVAIDQRALPSSVKVKGDGTYTVTLRPGASAVLEIPVLDGKTVIRTFP